MILKYSGVLCKVKPTNEKKISIDQQFFLGLSNSATAKVFGLYRRHTLANGKEIIEPDISKITYRRKIFQNLCIYISTLQDIKIGGIGVEGILFSKMFRRSPPAFFFKWKLTWVRSIHHKSLVWADQHQQNSQCIL